MAWYIGIPKGVTGSRSVKPVPFKSMSPIAVYASGKTYHEVRGPFREYLDAVGAAQCYHLDSCDVIHGKRVQLKGGK